MKPTNSKKNVLYCGVTNDLLQRVVEHYLCRGKLNTFAGKYYCYWLIYYEDFKYVNLAIAREKEVKNWSREKKERLIRSLNKDYEFLNFELFDCWPPSHLFHRKDA
jgi:putative endonuclease